MAPISRELMRPLRITAHLLEGVVFTRPVMLDALLMDVAANEKRRALPPIPGAAPDPVHIPIARSECGRVHLCSQGFCDAEESEERYTNQRPVTMEFARLGNEKVRRRRVDIASGPDKGYRSPYALSLLRGNRIEWWCIGDPERVRVLLSRVQYVGKKRGSGKGLLDIHGTPWTVEECEPWGDGFPVLDVEGHPMRPLPVDYSGLAPSSRKTFCTMAPPYWDMTRTELCAVPTTPSTT
jgi:hypothetical protein